MSLRLLEMTVPADDLERVVQVTADESIIDLSTLKTYSNEGLVRILVKPENVESVTDVLTRHFGTRAGFRLVALPVEATLPAVEEKSADARPDDEKAPAKKSSRISREELYQDLVAAADLTPVYIATVVLSTIVAAVALIRGDVAILIGAMVIAPLLGSNVALALATTLGDGVLARRALVTISVGVLIAAAVSVLIGALFDIDPTVSVLAARTHAGPGDIVLALAAGSAGALAFTTGIPAAVVGVMVAVALLPPLVAAGLMFGSGENELAYQALILLLTNVVCVNLAAVGTFLLQKVRPRTWWEAKKAKRASQLAVAAWVLLLGLLVVLMWLQGLLFR